MTDPVSSSHAHAALREHQAARVAVAAASARFSAWMVGLAASSSLFVFMLGWWPVTAVEPIVTSSLVFVLWVAIITVWLIAPARVFPAGFNTQFGLVMGAWGLVFGLAVGLGLAFEWGRWFLWPMAALTAVPLLVGAHLLLRSPSRG